MRTPVCREFGIELPIFAFSHCRDVVAEVTRAGGMGVFGAAGCNAEQLERELCWIDERVGDKPYAVDLLMPNRYQKTSAAQRLDPGQLIPAAHREFARRLLDDAGVPPLPALQGKEILDAYAARINMTPDDAEALIDVSLQHPQVRLIVSALGVAPQHLIERIHARGIKLGALVGKPCRALRSELTEAWLRADAPAPLTMPLQTILMAESMKRLERHPDTRFLTYPVGQIVGDLQRESSCRQIIEELLHDYLAAIDRLHSLGT
ncbi:MAG: monooxygenase [Hydrocarboniphaga sp.]|uniref:hypothetical protein n=1 Tax=Hydrocarboniphaga sp. TaxID=2033016 RepID=UPI0026175721|nr:hypothetical protein [Hydrocarboniphaga sp.]MDB5969887.1 monooxygenase [Hydrocarboniphaga sp.]